jgi:Skp family chaperone for outer membrane proteins
MLHSNSNQKLAVLESKLSMYEDLSREMLSKLESAVEKISEGNSRIANMLAKHDERIEQATKTDQIIIKMVEDIKDSNQEEHKLISKRFEKIEQKIEDLSKFKWQTLTIATIAVIAIGVLPSIIPYLVDKATHPSYNRENHSLSR